jgi:hypothetical protein
VSDSESGTEWVFRAPEDFDLFLRDTIPDAELLAFYQWVGREAVSEAIDDIRQSVDDDPTPTEHRYHTREAVHEFLDGPEEGGPYPSVLPGAAG